jgi:predicted GNAT superfamily acetyltransferase
MEFIIRDVTPADLNTILRLNEQEVPAVSSVPIEKMQWFAEQAAYFRVAMKDDQLAAFLIGLRPGINYDSPNYRWFCERYEDFGYIDRIAVASHARRHGLATRMYDGFKASLPGGVDQMACEVNLRPPNESSMHFHERNGFEQVGSQTTEGGNKEVAMMVRNL